ncbi:MAG: DUF4136 domain-containing protein [Bacteroidota bacterium]
MITKYDTTADFSAFSTFAVRDTIAITTENPKDSVWYDSKAQSIISEVVNQMQAAGYTRVPVENKSADLAIQVSAIRNVNVYVTPGYWWGWSGYADPCYWNNCYPYYYPYWYGYAVKTGTIMVEIADLKNAPKTRKLNILWSGIGSGQIGDSKSFIVDQCIKSVNQAFTQSPFFKVY